MNYKRRTGWECSACGTITLEHNCVAPDKCECGSSLFAGYKTVLIPTVSLKEYRERATRSQTRYGL